MQLQVAPGLNTGVTKSNACGWKFVSGLSIAVELLSFEPFVTVQTKWDEAAAMCGPVMAGLAAGADRVVGGVAEGSDALAV